MNQNFYLDYDFKILDEFYSLNNFIFYFKVEESPIIFGKQMPSNHVKITQTSCGIKSINKNAREINLNNSRLELYNNTIYPDFEKLELGVKKICINYCEFGGINALIIDGKTLECKDFSLLDGVNIGNNIIKVIENTTSGKLLGKKGTIIVSNVNCLKNVSIFGQELYIDNIKFCVGKCVKTLKNNQIYNKIGRTVFLSTLNKNI